LFGSPAIDVGDNALVPAGVTTDQRGPGFERFVGTVDIGAFEFGAGPANNPPVNTVPGSQSTPEDAPLVFSSATGNALAVSDAEAGANPVRVTLSVTDGTLTLSTTTGLTFSSGDGTGDASMTFTGTIAAINAALDALRFTPTLNYNGLAELTIVTNDLGSTGSGGALT